MLKGIVQRMRDRATLVKSLETEGGKATVDFDWKKMITFFIREKNVKIIKVIVM